MIKAPGFLVLCVAFPIILIGVSEKVLMTGIFSCYKIEKKNVYFIRIWTARFRNTNILK